MNYNAVILADSFKRSVKKLEKRFPSVRQDVKIAIKVLSENPKLGVLIPGGCGVRKLRIRNSDIQRGKSGSYRLLYYENQGKGSLCLLLLYAKTDRENVALREIQDLMAEMSADSSDKM